jgi:hypothetical protein
MKNSLNPQPLPPQRVASAAPAWWPETLWQLHFPVQQPGSGPGPVNYPPAIDDIMAGLHIHTFSYLMDDQEAAQAIRTIAEEQLTRGVNNLTKAHDASVTPQK